MLMGGKQKGACAKLTATLPSNPFSPASRANTGGSLRDELKPLSSFFELESRVLELFLSPLPVDFLLDVFALESALAPEAEDDNGTVGDVVCCDDDVCLVVETSAVLVLSLLEMSPALGVRLCLSLGLTVSGVSADSNDDDGAPGKNARTPICAIVDDTPALSTLDARFAPNNVRRMRDDVPMTGVTVTGVTGSSSVRCTSLPPRPSLHENIDEDVGVVAADAADDDGGG